MNINKKLAVVELSPRHDEIFPTWLSLSRKSNYDIAFFISQVHAERDIFSILEENRPEIYLHTAIYNQSSNIFIKVYRHLYTLVLRIKMYIILSYKYDIIIANSIEPDYVYQDFFRFLKKPTLSLVHNGYSIINNIVYKKLLANKLNRFSVLSKHVSTYLTKESIKNYTIYPVFGLSHILSIKQNRSFCVQGNIDFRRRNYDSLIVAVKKLNNMNNFCNINIVGKKNRLSEHFNESILKSGIQKYFTFHFNCISYEQYYTTISKNIFMLILIDDGSLIYKPFFEDKCTSSINLSLALGIIPVVNHKLADLYDLHDCCVKYEHNDVFSAISTALLLDQSEIDAMRTKLLQKRADLEKVTEFAFNDVISSY